MAPVPFLDLKDQYASIQPEIDAALRDVFASGRFILGANVEAFEREFAAYCGAKHGIGVGSGTEAIHLALRACGIGPGDDVVTVPNTAIATIAAIEQTGARAVLADVDATRTLDPSTFEAAVTPRTKAVVPVHLYGLPADLDALCAVAQRHGIRVIEDAAQAHGATYRARRVGGIGDLACWSFYPTKNLGAYGDGGLITTNDDSLADRLCLLRQYGWRARDHSVLRGINSRLDEMQAAVLRVKLRHLDAWNARRRELAAAYDRLLPAGIGKPPRPAGRESVYHLYVIESPLRNELRAHLKAAGIETLVHYPVPAHLQEAYADLGYPPGAFPVAERLARQIVSLPLYPEMADEAVERVCQEVVKFQMSEIR